VRLEVLDQLRNSITSSGIENTPFRLVAQCLNQLRYRGSLDDDDGNDSFCVHIQATVYLKSEFWLFVYRFL
jgi:hypothetical protein